MMIVYAQSLKDAAGFCSVGHCNTREEAVRKCVSLAIKTGMCPPRWWRFWLPKWPKDCVAEYKRQQ